MTDMTRADVVAAVRGLRRLPAGSVEIACDNVDAIPMRDALDLYLALAGGAAKVWCDAAGRRSPAGGAVAAATRLARDAAALPFLIARHLPAIATLKRAGAPAARPEGLAPILFLRTDHWFNITSGGSVGHLRGVIDNFRALGHETQVVSTDTLAGVPDDDAFHLCAPRYATGRNLPSVPELEYNRALLEFVAARWEGWAPRVVYQRLSLLSYAGAALKARYGVPFVCEYNGSLPWIARHWDRRPIRFERLAYRTEQASLTAADLIVVVSAESRNELLARGIAEERILVNPNGVDDSMFRPSINPHPLRERLGLADMLVVGHIGTFGPWHGAETLVEAFANLLDRRPDLKDRLCLLMIGDGVRRAAAEARAHARGIASSVVFTGRIAQAEAPAHLAACDILASPHVANPDETAFFGSPTKLFEYMAMGRAIVASDLGQIGEVLRDGETAVMAPAGDADALANGIERLAEDAGLRARLGSSARRKAVEHFTWHAHARRIVDTLDARLSRQSPTEA